MTLPPPSASSVAVVTGASSGVGEQFTRQLVARGHRVVVTARREDRVNRIPGFAHVSAERVVAEALKAADRGHASVVPGGPQVKLTLVSTRFVPTPLVLPVLKRMLKR
jgi:short-subunit dehydrogenase